MRLCDEPPVLSCRFDVCRRFYVFCLPFMRLTPRGPRHRQIANACPDDSLIRRSDDSCQRDSTTSTAVATTPQYAAITASLTYSTEAFRHCSAL